MTDPDYRPYRIVAAVDGSDLADVVVEHVLDIASRRGGTDLHFLRVVEIGRRSLRSPDGAIDAAHADVEALVRSKLEVFGEAPADQSSWSVRVHVTAGIPAEEILELAACVEADLLVLGRWGSEQRRRKKLGSVPTRVLAEASCPVLVEQSTDYEAHRSAHDTCFACVEARRTSAGERWFCAEHAGGGEFRSTTLIAQAYVPVHGHVPR